MHFSACSLTSFGVERKLKKQNENPEIRNQTLHAKCLTECQISKIEKFKSELIKVLKSIYPMMSSWETSTSIVDGP